MPRNIPLLVLSIGLCLGVGILGSFFTFSAIPTWYANLNKPSFSPPNWIFGPVWTTLYVLMGISLYLVISDKYRSDKRQVTRSKAVALFGIQLFLNAIWSIIFFGLKNPGPALMDVIALWITIILTIKSFYKISKPASYLLIPYLLWVTFATFLNYNIWVLNR